jgi:hypothetical protein
MQIWPERRADGSHRQGLFYAPSPPPQANSVAEMRRWCAREFERLADVLREGGVQSLRLDVQKFLPDKPVEGMIMYFAANVVTAGSEDGSYEYSSGAWFKL